jgi:protein-L-isoaspartate(D-aspartate) O-methyltransferase
MAADRLGRMRFLLDSSAAFALLLLFVPLGAEAQDAFAAKRRQMIESQIRGREIRDERVLDAMAKVPRHLFVPETVRAQAYEDYPLPIGADQTISQPYIVALMTSLLDLRGGERVLEIGTGSGYQAAVLGELAGDVYTIEILESLGRRAKETLDALGYRNVQVKIGDGFAGWPEHAPYDGIVVTAAPPKVPQPLLDQLKVGGKLVIPVGRFFQDLLVYTRTEKGFEKRNVIPVRFVPMTGEAEKSDARP